MFGITRAQPKSMTIHRLSVRMARDGPLDLAGHPHYLDAARNAGIALTKGHVVRNLMDQTDIAQHVLDACRSRLERQEPNEARHVERFNCEALGLYKVGQRHIIRRPLTRHWVSWFRRFSYVPGRNDFVNPLRGGGVAFTVVLKRYLCPPVSRRK